MSELTQCNYCSHRRSLERAKKKGLKLTVLPNSLGMGGVSEYLHPPSVNVSQLPQNERKEYEEGWYMDLPNHCCC